MEGVRSLKNQAFYKVICLLPVCITVFLTVVTTTLAWSRGLNVINEFIGAEPESYTVVLQKYEKDIDGTLTAIPIKDAEFYLYREDAEGDTQIGGRFSTDENGRITVTGLSEGAYYFLETDPTYAYTYDRDADGDITKYVFTIDAGTDSTRPVTVNACNQRRHSSLEISKKVQNADGTELSREQKEQAFVFTVTFSDGGTYQYKTGSGEHTLESGGTLTLTHGQTAIFERLPVGVQYTITETPVPGYGTTSTNSQGHIQAAGVTAAFVNTCDKSLTGSLAISKQVSGTGADPDKEFRFTVTFDIPGTYRCRINGGPEQTLESGGVLTLKDNETAIFENLPTGTGYTVEEEDYTPDGYTAAVQKIEGSVIPTGSEAGFHNIYDSPVPGSGSLQISKRVSGLKPEPEKEFAFTITFSDGGTYGYSINDGSPKTLESGGSIRLKHGETAVFEDLPAGILYTVTEEDISGDGYIPGIRHITGTIADDTVSEAAFHNYKNDKGDTTLVVKKLVEGEIPETDKDKEFNFTVTINGEKTRFSLRAGEERTFTLPLGAAYEVSEEDYFADGYLQSSVINGNGTASGQAVECIVTNTFIGTVMTGIGGVKTWDTAKAPGIALPDSITVYLKNGSRIVAYETVRPDSAGKWEYTFTVPKYDAQGKEIKYTVDEADLDHYEKTISGYNIKNTYVPGVAVDLAAEKVVIGSPEEKSDFTFQLVPVTEEAPMPTGTTNRTKTATVTGPGKTSFGTVNFDTVGEYVYKITEVQGNADGYTYDTTVYTATVRVTKENQELKADVTYTKQGQNTAVQPVFTNTYGEEDPPVSDEKVTISGTKTWRHGSNPVTGRPESITVYIKNGDTTVVTKEVTAEDHWKWTFKLPKYDGYGNEIGYTVDEGDISGYAKYISGYDIVNTHSTFKPDEAKVTVSGKKIWEHGSIDASKKPESIILYVKNGSQTVARKQVTAADQWSWSISLPKYEADGITPVTYTVSEGNVPYYTATVKGYNITNTFKGYDYPGDNPGTGSNPKTGDNTPIWLWITVMAVSALLLVITFTAGRRAKKRRK